MCVCVCCIIHFTHDFIILCVLLLGQLNENRIKESSSSVAAAVATISVGEKKFFNGFPVDLNICVNHPGSFESQV